jgi:hypothetical protein
MADISTSLKNPPGIPFKGVKTLSASETLTKEDLGKLIVFDSTTTIVATLPKSRKGATLHFQVRQLTTSGGHTITPATSETIYFKGGSTASNTTSAQCSAVTDAIGDGMTIVGDGNAGWHAVTVLGTWARV